MKKVVLLCAVLALVFFTACDKAERTSYTNENLGFSIELPESFEGNYEVIEGDRSVAFYQTGTVKKYGYGTGKLFTIEQLQGEIPEDEAENTPWPTHFLMHSNGCTYVMSMPSDVQSPVWDGGDKMLAEQYEKMQEQIEYIRKSIKPISK